MEKGSLRIGECDIYLSGSNLKDAVFLVTQSLNGVIHTIPNSRLWIKSYYSPYCICFIYTF